MTTTSKPSPDSFPEASLLEDTTEGCALKLVSIALTLLGVIRRDAGRFDEALRDLTWAIRNWPENGSAHYHRAIVYAYLGHKRRYAADWESAEKLIPDFAESNFMPVSLRHAYVLEKFMEESPAHPAREVFPATPDGLAAVLRRAAETSLEASQSQTSPSSHFRVVERLCVDLELIHQRQDERGNESK